MKFEELLTQIGVDAQATVARLGGMEEILRRFILTFPQDPTFSALAKAYDSRDMEALGRHVHTLKGLTANLGIEPLRQLCTEYLEGIRANLPMAELTAYQRRLTLEYRRVSGVISRYEADDPA